MKRSRTEYNRSTVDLGTSFDAWTKLRDELKLNDERTAALLLKQSQFLPGSNGKFKQSNVNRDYFSRYEIQMIVTFMNNLKMLMNKLRLAFCYLLETPFENESIVTNTDFCPKNCNCNCHKHITLDATTGLEGTSQDSQKTVEQFVKKLVAFREDLRVCQLHVEHEGNGGLKIKSLSLDSKEDLTEYLKLSKISSVEFIPKKGAVFMDEALDYQGNMLHNNKPSSSGIYCETGDLFDVSSNFKQLLQGQDILNPVEGQSIQQNLDTGQRLLQSYTNCLGHYGVENNEDGDILDFSLNIKDDLNEERSESLLQCSDHVIKITVPIESEKKKKCDSKKDKCRVGHVTVEDVGDEQMNNNLEPKDEQMDNSLEPKDEQMDNSLEAKVCGEIIDIALDEHGDSSNIDYMHKTRKYDNSNNKANMESMVHKHSVDTNSEYRASPEFSSDTESIKNEGLILSGQTRQRIVDVSAIRPEADAPFDYGSNSDTESYPEAYQGDTDFGITDSGDEDKNTKLTKIVKRSKMRMRRKKAFMKRMKVFHCGVCRQTRRTEESLAKHMSHHVACVICGVMLSNASYLRKHKEQHHPARHEQTRPGEAVKQEIKTEGTSRNLNDSGEEYHDCAIKTESKQHGDKLSCGDDQSVFACDVCHRTYSASSSLVCHRRNKHAIPKRSMRHTRLDESGKPRCKSWLCDICGKTSLSSKMSYNRHVSLHTKPFVCNICGTRWQTESYMNKHKVVHSDERNYLCTLCGSSFKQNSALRTHVQNRHDNKRAYRCATCPKTFNTNNTLKRHYREVHDNIRPFICQFCDKAFANSTNLRVHLASHERGFFQKFRIIQ